MNVDNKTFCILPFTMMSTTNSGDYRTCCEGNHLGFDASKNTPKEVWNSEFYKQLRKGLLSGHRHPNCNRCWKWEDKKGHSTRINENKSLDQNEIDNLLQHYDFKTGELKTYPKLFEFKLGNLCNLKCIMCTQLESSQHQTEVKKIKSEHKQNPPQLLDYIDRNFQFKREIYEFEENEKKSIIDKFLSIVPYLQTIKLVGGEPFKNPLTFDLLNTIYESNNQTINIDIITNLSDIDGKKINFLNNFPNLHLIVSLDSVYKDSFEFIRYPANYDYFKQNLELLIQQFTGKISFSITINIFNVFEIEDILNYLDDINSSRSVNPLINAVMDPKYFSVPYLNKDSKKLAIDKLTDILSSISELEIYRNNYKIKMQLEGIRNLVLQDPDDYNNIIAEQKRVLILYDKVRNQSYRDVFRYLD